MDPAKTAIRASTQNHLEIEDIQDDLVILKDGGAVLVLITTAINFGLLSEKEQDATIYAYAALINSLTYSIQIIIRSQKKDISSYLKLLSKAEAAETKAEVKEQIKKYKEFVEKTVAKNEVLDKKFYLAIPMSALEVGVTKAFASSFRRKKKLPFSKDYILDKAKASLYPKRDHLIKQLSRLGLQARQLSTRELIQLYFEIYNPDAQKQPVGQAVDYQAPIIEKASEIPVKTEKPSPSQPDLQDEISHLVKKST